MHLRYAKLVILAALIVTMIGAVGTAVAAGQTAKAALPDALAAAKQWQRDAVLVSLSSVTLQSDGTAIEWKYSFYSPGTKRRCVVSANHAGIRTKEVNLGYSTDPLGEFIDSDKAMQEAKKQGLKGNEPNMAVKFQGTGSGAAAYWIVNGGFAKGDVSVFLEASTGKFSSRSTNE